MGRDRVFAPRWEAGFEVRTAALPPSSVLHTTAGPSICTPLREGSKPRLRCGLVLHTTRTEYLHPAGKWASSFAVATFTGIIFADDRPGVAYTGRTWQAVHQRINAIKTNATIYTPKSNLLFFLWRGNTIISKDHCQGEVLASADRPRVELGLTKFPAEDDSSLLAYTILRMTPCP